MSQVPFFQLFHKANESTITIWHGQTEKVILICFFLADVQVKVNGHEVLSIVFDVLVLIEQKGCLSFPNFFMTVMK